MISILSWNIQYGRGVDNRVDLPRIRDHIVAMGDPDVICLQEVSVGFEGLAAGADQADELTRLFPGFQAVIPPALAWYDGPRVRRFGNAILTRLPLLETLSHPLPRPADGNTPHMQRQLIEILVAVDGGALRIATTHLEYYSILQRRAQARRLRELEAQWSASRTAPPRAKADVYAARPIPIGSVVCGDFNFPVSEDTYQAIQQPLDAGQWIDAWQVLGQGRPHAPTCGIFDHDQWPDGGHARDFFFVSAGLSDRLVELQTDVTTDLSDHQPIRLTLRA